MDFTFFGGVRHALMDLQSGYREKLSAVATTTTGCCHGAVTLSRKVTVRKEEVQSVLGEKLAMGALASCSLD